MPQQFRGICKKHGTFGMIVRAALIGAGQPRPIYDLSIEEYDAGGHQPPSSELDMCNPSLSDVAEFNSEAG